MSESDLPISNIINISVTQTPVGIATKNVNNIALFTQDPAINGELFGQYVSPSQVAANYGSNSKTAAMANNLFAQLPNLLSGDGQLVVIPMIGAVSATAGKFTSANISANLAALIAVTNGDLRVTIDTVVQNLHGVNLSHCVTLADIAAVLQGALIDVGVANVANTLVFTSFKVGTASTVVLAANAAGGTDLTGAGLLNTAAGASVAGANSSGETIITCYNRTFSKVSYTPIMSTLDLEDAAIEAVATAIQALPNMFFQHVASTQDILGIGTTVQQASQKKTRILGYFTGGIANANLMKAAYVGRAFSTNFDGSDTAATMNLKQLVNVTPDQNLTQTLYDEAQTAGVDLYVSFAGFPSVVSTGGNDFFDNQYFALAFKFALEAAGFNYLAGTNTKIPQTEPGITGLKNAYREVCIQFATNGCIAPGFWNSGETFGDPQIFNNNIQNNGYYIYSLPLSVQSSDDRSARKAPLIQIACKEGGAVQSSNVLVVINP